MGATLFSRLSDIYGTVATKMTTSDYLLIAADVILFLILVTRSHRS